VAIVGFLHTSDAHVPSFAALMRELAPDVVDIHVVDEDLLRDARRGGVDAELRARLLDRLHGLVGRQADVVVCTCSTLGGHAEEMSPQAGVRVLRVDRPMAEAAVTAGGRVAVVAALESTLAPTRRLLDDCAAEAGSSLVVVDVPCLDAWVLFEAGDEEGYLRRIAEQVRAVASSVDVIVLAQASMAPAIARLSDLTVPVLSSPRPAVQRAAALAVQWPASAACW
jgi:aspartate/glutamate racemase